MTSISITTPSRTQSSPEDASLKPHHNKNGKGFISPWPSFRETNFWTIMRWVWLGKIEGTRKDPDLTGPLVPVHQPSFLPTRETPSLRATWLGHACFYLEFPNGLRVLFDPVFEERCSPFSFAGPKRYTKAPCTVEDLPFVDVLVISHNHYDHMSWPTLQKVRDRFPGVQVFTPLGNRKWFVDGGFKNVDELDWWKEREVKIIPEAEEEEMEARIGCLPAQHTSARFGWDKGERLWGSFSIEAGGKKVWFAGDTGYRTVPMLAKEEDDYGEAHKDLPHCPVFEQIGELRGPFDLGLIPIGAYEPRWLMSPVHANPYDAVNIFAETRCKRALGIHWGTWILTEEEVLEPPQMLRQALKRKGLQEEGVFEVCDIGTTRDY